MQYVRTVDLGAFRPDDFHSQIIADRSTGLDDAVCLLTRVPPGKATPAGLHVHPADQFYYVINGAMTAQLGTKTFTAGPHTLVYIPAGLPHFNWNDTGEDELHFELICPHPSGALGEPVSQAADLPDKSPLVRKLDFSKFGSIRGSALNLAQRTSGVDTLSWNVFRVQPEGGVRSMHIHGFTHIYYVISGTMTLYMGVEEYELPPHTLGIVPGGMVHSNANRSGGEELHLNIRIPDPEDQKQQGANVQILAPTPVPAMPDGF